MSAPKIHSILVATDLETGSDAALRTAGRLAESSGAELHVLHALEPDPAPSGAEDDPLPSFPGRLRQAESALAAQLARELPEQIRVADRRVVGRTPFLAITEAADDLGCDLVVMGHHHPHPMGDGVRDATLDRAIRRLTVPCLVVGDAPWRPIRRALVPVDLSGSPESAVEAALGWLVELSRATGAPAPVARLLSVVPPFMRDAAQPLGIRGVRHWMRRLVDGAQKGSSSGVTVGGSVKSGSAVPEMIARAADAMGADLIVLAAHGRHSVARMLLGAVSGPVTRRTHRPVLLLPHAVWSAHSEPGLSRVARLSTEDEVRDLPFPC
jgi:nucleotide-binding universal stress UspA family protein